MKLHIPLKLLAALMACVMHTSFATGAVTLSDNSIEDSQEEANQLSYTSGSDEQSLGDNTSSEDEEDEEEDLYSVLWSSMSMLTNSTTQSIVDAWYNHEDGDTYTMTEDYTGVILDSPSGDALTDTFTIDGSENHYVIYSYTPTPPTVILYVSATGDLTVKNVYFYCGSEEGQVGLQIIRNLGTLSVSSCLFDNLGHELTMSYVGGAISNEGGAIDYIDNCIFQNFYSPSQYAGALANIQGGYINNITSCSFINNYGYCGGAIYNTTASAISSVTGLKYGQIELITDTVFSGNSAVQGGAIYNAHIINEISNCTFEYNSADQYGGALMLNIASGLTLTEDDYIHIINSTFTSNTVIDYYGGAICLLTTVYIDGSTFTSNSAVYGGAIMVYSGACYITDSSFIDNYASTDGGAIYNLTSLSIRADGSDVLFDGNTVAGTGQAICNEGSIYLYASAGQSVIFNDTIYNYDMTYTYIGYEDISSTGTVAFNATIDGFGTTSLYEGILAFGSVIDDNDTEDDTSDDRVDSVGGLSESSILSIYGGSLNLIDDKTSNFYNGEEDNKDLSVNLGNVTLYTNSTLGLDVDVSNESGDYLEAVSVTTNEGADYLISIQTINLFTDPLASLETDPMDIGFLVAVADDVMKAYLILADTDSLIIYGDGATDSADNYTISYLIIEDEGFLSIKYADLTGAIASQLEYKKYTMSETERIRTDDLVIMGGNTTEVYGEGNEVINGTTVQINEGGSLIINDVSTWDVTNDSSIINNGSFIVASVYYDSTWEDIVENNADMEVSAGDDRTVQFSNNITGSGTITASGTGTLALVGNVDGTVSIKGNTLTLDSDGSINKLELDSIYSTTDLEIVSSITYTGNSIEDADTAILSLDNLTALNEEGSINFILDTSIFDPLNLSAGDSYTLVDLYTDNYTGSATINGESYVSYDGALLYVSTTSGDIVLTLMDYDNFWTSIDGVWDEDDNIDSDWNSWDPNDDGASDRNAIFLAIAGTEEVVVDGDKNVDKTIIDAEGKDYSFSGDSITTGSFELLNGTATFSNVLVVTGAATISTGTSFTNRGSITVMGALNASGVDIINTGTLSMGEGSQTGQITGAGTVEVTGDASIAGMEDETKLVIAEDAKAKVGSDLKLASLISAGSLVVDGSLTLENATPDGGAIEADSILLGETGTFTNITTDSLTLSILGEANSTDYLVTVTETLSSLSDGEQVTLTLSGLYVGIEEGTYALFDLADDCDFNWDCFEFSDETLSMIEAILDDGYDIVQIYDGNDLCILIEPSAKDYSKIGLTHNGIEGLHLLPQVADTLKPQRTANRELYPELAAVLDDVDSYNDAGNYVAADSLAAASVGSALTAIGSASLSDLERQMRSMRSRSKSGSACVTTEKKHGAWIAAESGLSNMDNYTTSSGHDFYNWGGSLGYDMIVGKNTTVGIAFTSMVGDLSSDPTDSMDADMDNMYGSIYAEVRRNRWTHNFVGTVGTIDVDYSRRYSTTSLDISTEGNTDGMSFGLAYELSYSYELNENRCSVLQPLVAVSFKHNNISAFDEVGNDAALHVGRQENNYVTLTAGLEHDTIFGTKALNRDCLLTSRLTINVDIGDRMVDADVEFLALDGATQNIWGTDPGAVGIEFSLGVSIPINESSSIFMNVSAELRSELTEGSATLGYRFSF